MKKIIQTIALVFATGFIMTSCGDKYYYDTNESLESRRIVLSSQVTLQTTPRLQELHIENGQALSLFITPVSNTSEVLYSNINIIANGTGGFSNENLYYPSSGQHVDFYAMHPYSADATLMSPVSFSVQADQSDKSNFLNSDLLYATRKDQSRANNPVSLIFAHKLAKLDFTIENNDGLNLGMLNTVTVLNTLPATTINLIDGNISNATGTAVPIAAYGVAGSPEVKATVADIHAIVVPQTIPSGTPLFRMTIGTRTFVYSTTGDFTFVGGSKHAIKLTITGGEITLTSTISPWIDGASIGGGATPE